MFGKLDSSVGIVTGCGLDGSGFERRWEQEISSSPHLSRPAVTLTQSSVQWASGLLPGDKAAGGVALSTHPHVARRLKKK